MRIASKISFSLIGISFFMLTLLTVLMHFKLMSTSSQLFHQRLDTASFGLTRTIRNSLRLGIEIENLTILQEEIKSISESEKSITGIVLFKVSGDKLTKVFCNQNADLDDEKMQQILRTMRSSKSDLWKGAFPNSSYQFFGRTLRDVTETERTVIFIMYDQKPHAEKLKGEVHSLYKRLGFALIISCIINYIIGINNTRSIVKSLHIMRNSIAKLNSEGSEKIDLKELSPPLLTQLFRGMLSRLIKILQLITAAENVIANTKKDDNNV
jgi:uncharacterized protein YlaN (UPF0358 family)